MRKTYTSTYKESGVDVQGARRAIDLIRERVRSTYRPEVIGDIGGFGGLFAFDPKKFRDPVLVSSTDGVGTKVMIAEMAGVHEPVGFDLVAASTNDVAANGAEPLFFLDYIVIEKLREEVIDDLVKGMAEACREAGCSLIGGEIAEHPGHLERGTYDLAGFCVGVAEREGLVTGSSIKGGNVIIGIESSGLHCNGFSLVRKVLLEEMALKLEDRPMDLGHTLAEELLRPTKIYAPVLVELTRHQKVNGFAHISGGGIPGNLGRIMPDQLEAVVERAAWEVPTIFNLLSSLGRVDDQEMFSTFNMGLGMIVVVDSDDANHALDLIRSRGHRAHEIGVVVPASRNGGSVRIA